MNTCPNCGGKIVGDSLNQWRRCERAEFVETFDPDGPAVLCDYGPDDDAPPAPLVWKWSVQLHFSTPPAWVADGVEGFQLDLAEHGHAVARDYLTAGLPYTLAIVREEAPEISARK